MIRRTAIISIIALGSLASGGGARAESASACWVDASNGRPVASPARSDGVAVGASLRDPASGRKITRVACMRAADFAAAPAPAPAAPLWWMSDEALVWSMKAAPIPPTLTTFAAGSPSATTGFGGELGVPGTTVLSPGHLGFSPSGGDQLTVGRWLDDSRTWGIEASGFLIGDKGAGFSASSDGSTPLRVPFTNVAPGAGFPIGSSSFIIANPGSASGGQTISASARLWGLEADGLYRVNLGGPVGVTMIGGLRYLNLGEGLALSGDEIFAGSPAAYYAYDDFSTVNQFFGGEIGAKAVMTSGAFDVSLTGKVALGENYESLTINGETRAFGFGGAVATEPIGLFSEPSNIGHYNRDVFAVVPEVKVEAGYQATSAVRLFVDYDALFISNVLRPGNTVDTTVNLTQNPIISGPVPFSGVARPLPLFKSSSFLAQGFGFGIKASF